MTRQTLQPVGTVALDRPHGF